MGDKLSILQPLLTKESCMHDCYYYVLNESECHSNCRDACDCDCGWETHRIDQECEDEEDEVEIADCCLMRHRKGDYAHIDKEEECLQSSR